MEKGALNPTVKFTKPAFKALEKYNLKVQDVQFIQHSENVTFKVTASGKSYLLRLHLPLTSGMGTHGVKPEVIRSELRWVKSLLRNKLSVPRPLRNRSGGLVTRVTGIDGPLNCTVLEWLDGDLYTREMESEDTVAQIGRLVGRIHRHSSGWQTPKGFQRPVRDAAYFLSTVDSLLPAVDDGRINYLDFKALQTSVLELVRLFSTRRKSRATVGLIHGDLHRGNFINHNGEIRLIDFSLCAVGHFTYDLGTCLSNISPALHPVFLENYEQFFPLPKDFEQLVEGFFIASYVVTFSYWLENPEAQETLAQRVPFISQQFASRFNQDERFWFSA